MTISRDYCQLPPSVTQRCDWGTSKFRRKYEPKTVDCQDISAISSIWGFTEVCICGVPIEGARCMQSEPLCQVVLLKVQEMQGGNRDEGIIDQHLMLKVVPYQVGVTCAWTTLKRFRENTPHRSEIVVDLRCPQPVHGYLIGDVVEDWMNERRQPSFEDTAQFAEDVLKCCRLYDSFALYFNGEGVGGDFGLKGQLKAWYDAEVRLKNEERAAVATAVVSTLVVCTVQ